jgi:cation-transporting ATPase E
MEQLQGLSLADVQARRKAGQVNRVRLGASRSYAQIVRENAFTFINTVLFGIGVVLVIMHSIDNAIVTAGLVLLNVVVGVVQEGRAKRTLDRIALLTRPKATVIRAGHEATVDPAEIVIDDLLVLRPGDQVVVDGEVVGDGRMEVDESLLTGESDLIAKRAGDQLMSGSFCVTGSAAYVARRVGAESYASQITAGARAFRRIKTPLQHDIDFVIRIMVLLAGTLGVLLGLSAIVRHLSALQVVEIAAVVVVLVPQGLFFMTTVTYATGAVRMAGRSALIQQSNAIESLSNVRVLCMDKTGTLTSNRILYNAVLPLGLPEEQMGRLLGDFVYSVRDRNRTAEAIATAFEGRARSTSAEVAFSSARKWSGLTFAEAGLQGSYVLGAPEVLAPYVRDGESLSPQVDEWAGQGLRVLLFACSGEDGALANAAGEPQLPAELQPLALLSFSDELRPEAQRTLSEFSAAGIRLKIISGDNPHTVAALARQAGFDRQARAVSGLELAGMDEAEFARTADEASIFGRITPQQKERLVRALRGQGQYVAMIGDGVNDVLSLKQAQLGIAMESGSQATRSVADIVLLGDSFSALPAAFREGQRIIRGMQDIMRLFLARTLYITMLIVGASIIGTPFPVIPKHNFILALLTVGIPTLGLAAWAKPAPAGRSEREAGRPWSTIRAIRHYVFPAAITVTAVSLAVYLYGLLVPGGELTGERILFAQTALTTTTVLCGLILIAFVEPPVRALAGGDELSGDWRPTSLAGLMLVAYALMLAVPGLRAWFNLAPLSAPVLGLIVLLVILWAVVLLVVWRKRLFERLLELD